MTESIADQYRRGLARYNEDLLLATAAYTARFTRAKRAADAVEQIVRTIENPRALAKMIAALTVPQQAALAALARAAAAPMRWDHAVGFLQTLGIDSPYPALQDLLAAGLLWMRKATSDEPLVRYDVPNGAPPEHLPSIAVAAPLVGRELPSPAISAPFTSRSAPAWRSADGWEWPIRLAVLWRAAWLAPIKRTQQWQLFKKDRERLTNDPLLSSQTLDSLEVVPDPGLLAYHLAQEQNWLSRREDEQSPDSPLSRIWPDALADLLALCGRGVATADPWNELGADAPVGAFAAETPSARWAVLYWLSLCERGEGADVREIASALERNHPYWASSDRNAVLRNGKDRTRLCRAWTRSFLLGPAYQCGLVDAANADGDAPLVRLSDVGRRMLGLPVEPPACVHHPQALLVQPNHQIVVFRQALSVDLLTRLVLFAEPRSLGAALTFEITPASVYHGLEAGLSADCIVRLLSERSGGRPLPPGVQQSIETWARKRDRLAIYENVSLFEFASPEDMHDALSRGLEGEPVSDRILLVEHSDGAFKNLRISASRDYRLPPQPCVETGDDGVTLKVDLEKSDLLLESELLRFAQPLDVADANGRKLFCVTRQSLERAFELGWRIDSVEQWYQQRTGEPAPASVRLLLRALSGFRVEADVAIVLTVESPLVADGLMQHPRTAALISKRVGPCSLVVEEERVPELRLALEELGVDLAYETRRGAPLRGASGAGDADG
jgi:hypothetical protein